MNVRRALSMIVLAATTVLALRPPAGALAQAGAWETHVCGDCIYTVGAAGDAVWAGTFGAGVVRFDRRSAAWRRFTRADGLGGDTVRDMAVGPAGDVWAIALAGSGFFRPTAAVSHFDGTTWTAYTVAAEPWIASLSSNHAMAAGPRGLAAVSLARDTFEGMTGDGLARFDGAAWHVDGAAEGLDGPVRAVAIGPDGRAVAAIDRHVLRFDGGRWMPLPDDGRVLPVAKSLAVAADGTLYAASDTGVERFREAGWPEGGHWRHDALTLGGATKLRLQVDTGGAPAWLISIRNNTDVVVHRFDGVRWQRRAASVPTASHGDLRVVEATIAPDGRLWLGQPTRGIAIWDGAHLAARPTGEGLPGLAQLAIAADARRHVWVGMLGLVDPDNFLAEYDGVRWSRHSRATGLPEADTIFGVFQGGIVAAPDGTIWLNERSAVAHFDGRAWRRYTPRDGLPNGYVNHVAADGHGGAWAATSAGIGRFDGAWWRRVPAADAALPGVVNAVAVDHHTTPEVVWIGGDHGAARFDGASWQIVPSDADSAGATLWHAAVDNTGEAWFTTTNGLVVRCDAALCRSVGPTDGSMDGSRGWGIALDAAGHPWIAATEAYSQGYGGLFHYDGAQWSRYSRDDGMLDDEVFDVAVDVDGRVWVAALGGVSVFTPASAGP